MDYAKNAHVTPLVSILIPTFNRAGLVESAIESALVQSERNIEIVVVDNASTDDSWTRIEALAKKDPRIRAEQNLSGIAPVENWRRCVELATGVYAKFLWSDDLLAPDCIEKMAVHLHRPEIGFVISAAQLIDDQAKNLHVLHRIGATKDFPSSAFIEGVLLEQDYPVSPGCALFRTEDLRRHLADRIPNRFDSDFAAHAIGIDALLMLRIAQQYPRFHFISKPLCLFRDHPGSITASTQRKDLLILYCIAKAYFVSEHPQRRSLARRFNTRLWLHRWLHHSRRYPIRSLQDFYPLRETRIAEAGFSTLYLIKCTLLFLLSALAARRD